MKLADHEELRAAARLLGLLLLREVDDELLALVGTDDLRRWFFDQGLDLPAVGDRKAQDQLAAAYFDTILSPKNGSPPVHSLVSGSGFEGEPAAGMRRVAEELGAVLSEDVARGAPVDHLGSELCLWAEIAARSPHSAPEFAKAFLTWAPPWCARRAEQTTGFYSALFRLTSEFVDVVLAQD